MILRWLTIGGPCYYAGMNPFNEMLTHEMNDINMSLWLAFFGGFVIISMVISYCAPRRRRVRSRKRLTH